MPRLQCRTHASEQLGADKRLRDHVKSSQIECFDSFLGRRQLAVKDHRHQPRRIVFFHAADERKSTVGGQTKLREDEVGLEALKGMDGRDQVAGRVDLHLAGRQDRSTAASIQCARARRQALAAENGATPDGRAATYGFPINTRTTEGKRDLTTERTCATDPPDSRVPQRARTDHQCSSPATRKASAPTHNERRELSCILTRSAESRSRLISRIGGFRGRVESKYAYRRPRPLTTSQIIWITTS